MPDAVRGLLPARGLIEAYNAHPDYQRNDYIGWILQARRLETKQKRLDQILDDPAKGGLYMNMPWRLPSPSQMWSV